jgi:hypothetical protein
MASMAKTFIAKRIFLGVNFLSEIDFRKEVTSLFKIFTRAIDCNSLSAEVIRLPLT